MKINKHNIKKIEGLQIKNQYNETVTVLEVVGNSVKVVEENNYYHITKLFHNGTSLANLLK